MKGKCDNKERGLNWAYPFPRVSGYKRGDITKIDIIEGDITEVRVYLSGVWLGVDVWT